MEKNRKIRYYPRAEVICACGNKFTVGSTKPEIRVDICSACHPFFTGQMKYVDTGGRVKRFEDRLKQAKSRSVKRSTKKIISPLSSVRTLKEMLEQAK